MSGAAVIPPARYSDDPEWQAAQADYIAEHGSIEETFAHRIEAACRLREIEKKHP